MNITNARIAATGKEIHFKEFLGIYSVYLRFSVTGNHRLLASSSLATLSARLTVEKRGLCPKQFMKTRVTNASCNPFSLKGLNRHNKIRNTKRK